MMVSVYAIVQGAHLSFCKKHIPTNLYLILPVTRMLITIGSYLLERWVGQLLVHHDAQEHDHAHDDEVALDVVGEEKD